MTTSAGKKKTVLIVSCFFPPANTIAAVRVGKFAKYLPQFGWEPVVLTADEVKEFPQGLPVETDESMVFRTPYFAPVFSLYRGLGGSELTSPHSSHRALDWKRLFHKAVRLARPIYNLSILQPLLWDPIGWYPHAVKKGREILEKYEIDAIFSSYSPSTSHLVASRLQRISGLPWVADFRDLWAQNPNYRGGRVLQTLEKRLEKRVMKNSSLLITVSEPLAQQLEVLHAKRAATIHNGFDEDDYIGDVPPTAKFTVTYTGWIYEGKQDCTPLLEAVRGMQQQGEISAHEFEIRFFGPNVVDAVSPFIEEYGLQELATVHGTIPFRESIRRQRESSILLLLKWNDPEVKGFYTGKLFEYVGAERPILAVGPFEDEFVDKLLVESGTGVALSGAGEIKACLSQWIEEFRQSGEVTTHYNPNRDVIALYTRKKQAEKLAQLLEEVSSPEKSSSTNP